jgi:hypothetical protein
MWILKRMAHLLQELEHDGFCEDPEEIWQGFSSYLLLTDAIS